MVAAETIRSTQERLKERGVKYCIGAYVDIHGVPKGKVVPIAHLEHMAHGSERYTGYALDGLGQEPHDDEITSIPDLDHIIQLPWEPKVARVQRIGLAVEVVVGGEPGQLLAPGDLHPALEVGHRGDLVVVGRLAQTVQGIAGV